MTDYEIRNLKDRINHLQNVHQLDSIKISQLKSRAPKLDEQRFVAFSGITCHSRSHLIYFHTLTTKGDDVSANFNTRPYASFDKMLLSQLTGNRALNAPSLTYQFKFTFDEIERISPRRPYTLVTVNDDKDLFERKLKDYALSQLQKLQYQALSHTFGKN